MKKTIGKFGTVLIILATVILAGIAIFTALRLYQLRQQPVAPNVPSSQPKAVASASCTDDIMACPIGADKESVRRVPPDCNFESCYNSMVCTDDVRQCPDGTWVSRIPPNCDFAPCPGSCLIGFNLSSPTPTPSEEPTPTPSPLPGEPNSCGGTCGSDSNCKSGFYCNTSVNTLNGAAVSGVCRNPSCPNDSDCECPSGTNTRTTTPTEVALPQSGTNWPTFMGTGLGLLVIFGAILLAL